MTIFLSVYKILLERQTWFFFPQKNGQEIDNLQLPRRKTINLRFVPDFDPVKRRGGQAAHLTGSSEPPVEHAHARAGSSLTLFLVFPKGTITAGYESFLLSGNVRPSEL